MHVLPKTTRISQRAMPQGAPRLTQPEPSSLSHPRLQPKLSLIYRIQPISNQPPLIPGCGDSILVSQDVSSLHGKVYRWVQI